MDGDAVTVEELVMQFFASDNIDEDQDVFRSNDSRSAGADNTGSPQKKAKYGGNVSSHGNDAAASEANVALSQLYGKPPIYTGGQWHGWHCEGSPLRTIFGVIMWDVLFMEVENVFYSPYQDQPLDLLYGPLFYISRADAIERKFSWLLEAPMEEVLEFVSNTYRANYKSRCRGVQWSHPLNLIQAVCLCLKGKGLVSLCKLLIANFRHFQGGAPDLLLIRGYRKPMSKRGDNLCAMCAGSAVDTQTGASNHLEFINMDMWLGSDWRRFGSDRMRPSVHNEEDFYSLLHPRGGGGGGSADDRLDRNSIAEFFRSGGRGEEMSGTGKSSGASSIASPETAGSAHANKSAIDNNNGEDDGSAEFGAGEGDVAEPGDVPEAALTPKYNKFAYYGPDLQTPCRQCHDRCQLNDDDVMHAGIDDSALTRYSWIHEWTFECMFVEVKGPTDRLADRQAVWLHALEAGGAAGALVCQIREGRSGQQSGHHETGFVFMDDDE